MTTNSLVRFANTPTRRVEARVCARLLRGGSRSFWMASLLLPRQIRRSTTALYAFCRVADDAVDDGADPAHALDTLQDRVERMACGQPSNNPIDRALARAIGVHGMPVVTLTALLEGFSWDVAGRRYTDIGDLFEYCARVAGTVGVAVTTLMGIRSPAVLARASELGIAMQLTNIARDVGEDARRGRLYLPERWLDEEGIDPSAFLRAPRFSQGIAAVVARVLGTADYLYRRANSGIGALPWRCRPAIAAASAIYRDIGRVLADCDFDSVAARAVVSGPRKVAIAAQAAIARRPVFDSAAPLPATRFLVEAVERRPS